MLRVGIIGAGKMGQAHADTLARLPEAALTAVADSSAAKAQALADAYNAEATESVSTLLSSAEIDAVIIASPTPNHFEQARAAIESGKHVYIEAPVTRRLDEAEELARLVEKSKAIATVGHSQRFLPEYQMIKQQVAQNAVGKPGMIRLGRRASHPQGWRSDFNAGGGVVLDTMIHELDFLLWCFGPARRVYCQGLQGRRATDTLDYALAAIRLESNAIAHIESSWCHYGQFLLDVEIAGDKGLIHYDNQESIPMHGSSIDISTGGHTDFDESPTFEPAHAKILHQFIAAIAGEAENPVPVREGVQAVKLALAAIESMQANRPVAA